MSGFDAPPVVRGYSARLVELLEPLVYRDEARGLVVTVPHSLLADGASVPSWGWAMLSAGFVQLLGPGLLHDYLYRQHAVIEEWGTLRLPLSRGWSDRIFAEAMAAVGCSRGDQRKARLALAIGGAFSWRKKPVDWRG